MSTLKLLTRPLLLTTSLLLALALSLVGIATIASADGPGNLDLSFGGTGVVTTSIGLLDNAHGIALQQDGKLVVAGFTYPSYTDTNFAIVRLNPNGNLDTSFNGTGIVTTNINTGLDWPFAVALQSDEKILAVGFTGFSSDSQTLALVRYNPNGSLDTTFNGTGILTDAAHNFFTGYSVAQQADGKIVISGGGNCTPACIPVARYNPDGSPDLTFNGTGVVTTPVGSITRGFGLTLQADGKIVVAGGGHFQSPQELALIRYNPNGTLDTTFNSTGIVTASIGGAVSDVVIQPDGKIVAAGTVIIRYHSNGHLDSNFNGTGVITDPVLNIFAIALQPDGKIAATGYRDGGGFAVARYHNNGSPDLTFNHNSLRSIPVGDENGFGHSIIVQPDGAIVAAGSDSDAFAVVRYLGGQSFYLPLIWKNSEG